MRSTRPLGLACLVALGLSSVAAAEDAPGHPASGTWKISTPEAQLRTTLDKAVDDVAAEFNFMIRELARYKLQNATKVCKAYTIDVQDAGVMFACDNKKTVLVPTSGGPLHTTNGEGEPITGTAKVSADGVVVTWAGETGKRKNAFTASGGSLKLDVTVSSDQMPKPLTWRVDYKK